MDIFRDGLADAALAASIFHDDVQSIRALKDVSRRAGYSGALAVLIPCIDLQGGQAVQLVHGRKRELAVADVFGLLEKFKAVQMAARDRPGRRDGQDPKREARKDIVFVSRHGLRNESSRWRRNSNRGAGRQGRGWGAEQIIIGSAAFRDR